MAQFTKKGIPADASCSRCHVNPRQKSITYCKQCWCTYKRYLRAKKRLDPNTPYEKRGMLRRDDAVAIMYDWLGAEALADHAASVPN